MILACHVKGVPQFKASTVFPHLNSGLDSRRAVVPANVFRPGRTIRRCAATTAVLGARQTGIQEDISVFLLAGFGAGIYFLHLSFIPVAPLGVTTLIDELSSRF